MEVKRCSKPSIEEVSKPKTAKETATSGGAVAARIPHTDEVESSNLSPATITAEHKIINEIKKIFEKAAEKKMPVRATAGHWQKVDGKWKFFRDVTTPRTHSSKANPSVKRENLYLTVIRGNTKLPQPKGTPKPKMDMKREGRIIHIKGVGLARNVPKGRINRKRDI